MKLPITSFALAACASWAAMGQGAEPVSPTLRLPATVRPLRQAVALRIDPNQETFTGSVDIDVDLRAETPVLWLNAAAELEVVGSRLTVAGREVKGSRDPGRGELPRSGRGQPGGSGARRPPPRLQGLHQSQGERGRVRGERGGRLVRVHPVRADRRAPRLPLLRRARLQDSLEAPLRVPQGLVALANTPAESTRTTRTATSASRFAETKPLPSYLVAFAVGPFEVVDAGPAGRNNTPVRIVVPTGRGTRRALRRGERRRRSWPCSRTTSTCPTRTRSSTWSPSPASAFAMETPGLVTYGQGLMVQRPAEETTRRGGATRASPPTSWRTSGSATS